MHVGPRPPARWEERGELMEGEERKGEEERGDRREERKEERRFANSANLSR